MPKYNIAFDREGLRKDIKLAKRLVKKLKEAHVLIAMLQYHEPKEFSLESIPQKLSQASPERKKTEYSDEQNHQ